MYVVLLEPAAQRDMRRLTKPVHVRVLASLDKLEADPRHLGTKKLAGFEHQWRARVGEYRILYEIDDRGRTVHVYRVAHRSQSYR